jgi:serine/threonine-protein kinase
MCPTITLTLLKGDDVAGEYIFSNPIHYVVGRSADCDLALPPDPLHLDVSRHHCAFEIEPPMARVRDLGSLNGTAVNGIQIGRREDINWSGPSLQETSSAVELLPGDEVSMGKHTRLRVSISPPPEHAILGDEIAHHLPLDRGIPYVAIPASAY